jgi:hypothetical protein
MSATTATRLRPTAQCDIITALDHPHIFGPHFSGASWRPWRVLLKALFALPMTDDELLVYQRHTERVAEPLEPFREVALIVGRRGGKSRILALVAVYLATFRDYTPYLGAGEIATVAIIATNRMQARTIFRYVTGLLRAVPALARMITEETSDSITLNNRVVLEIHTASFRVTRGYSLAAVLCDETAYWRDETSANPDMEIFRALRPGLASIPGAILLNASSPYRKTGVLFSAFARHFGKDDARVLVWRGTTLEMNSSLDPAVVEEAYEDDPASAAAEYGAQFRSDIDDFVSRETVDACTVRGRMELLYAPSARYMAFVDPSGGSSDSMTVAVAHRDRDGIAILDAIREFRPPFSPEQVTAEIAALLKSYKIPRVTGDRYGGEWPREQFRNAGIQYDSSERPKSDIYRDALPLLNSGKLELLDNKRLASQLVGLERRTARGGRDSIDHAPGSHDDIANAALGALLLVGLHAPMQISQQAVDHMRTARFTRRDRF